MIRGWGIARGIVALALLFGAAPVLAGTVYRCDSADGARSYVSNERA